jgi:hypothetical protein
MGSSPSKADDFPVVPLSEVAASFADADCEVLTLLALRPAPLPMYALPLKIPPPGHQLREQGLKLLWARAVTVTSAIVGTSRLRLVCEHTETFDHLQAAFVAAPKVRSHLSQYGDFSLQRATAADVPAELRALPFSADSAPAQSDPGGAPPLPPPSQQLFVGVDYGRSDIKCAVVNGEGKELSTYVTRWWRVASGATGAARAAPRGMSSACPAVDTGAREYVDPAVLRTIDEPVRCLGEAAIEAVRLALKDATGGGSGAEEAAAATTILGLGMSAAGCVLEGKLCGLPPAFGGCDLSASSATLDRLESVVFDFVARNVSSRLGGLSGGEPGGAANARVDVGAAPSLLLVNDGDASAMWGSKRLRGDSNVGAIGLFLSCGTGLAGGIVRRDGQRCGGGVLEMGKLIIGLPSASATASAVPVHDTLGVAAAAQAMAGTQRSFFNLLAARGGERVEGKAEQRAAIVAMQKRPIDGEVRAVFHDLGRWLAVFVLELSEYLPFDLTHAEAGGKLTDAASGEVMLARVAELLAPRGVAVRRADESEFGQALAVAASAMARRPRR